MLETTHPLLSYRALRPCPCSVKPPTTLVPYKEGDFLEPGSIWLGDLGACCSVDGAGLLDTMSPW